MIVANHATGFEDDDAGSSKKIDTGLGSQGKNAVAMNVLAQLTALKEMTLNEQKAKWGTIFATPARTPLEAISLCKSATTFRS
ncbi:hypothetical protein N9F34_01835 [Alphaproteobacteria bacterium]|nr:hypothetical protein [Alphaproteobacteria bacterium]